MLIKVLLNFEDGRKLQSVVPVVIRQIRNCPDEEFNLFGMPAQIVSYFFKLYIVFIIIDLV